MKNPVCSTMLSMLILATATFLEAATGAENTDTNQISVQINGLSSDNGETVTESIKAISEIGVAAVPALLSAAKKNDAGLRMLIITTLSEIKDEKASKAMADIMCNETTPGTVAMMAQFIRNRCPGLPRTCLVPIASDPANSPQRRVTAAFYIRLAGDKECVDDLINILEANLVTVKRNVGLDLNMTRNEHVGDTDYSSQLQINSPGKGMSVPNKVTMPIIETAQVKTKANVNAQTMELKKQTFFATQTALEVITGQQFEGNISRWRTWWKSNRDSFGTPEIPKR